MSKKRRMATNFNDRDAARRLDELRHFEEFKDELLPKIRAMLRAGKKSAEIRDWAQAYLTARQVSIGLTSEDESMALKAIDSVTAQNEGKAVERSQVEHKFSKLSDEELDAVVLSRLQEVARTPEKGKKDEQH